MIFEKSPIALYSDFWYASCMETPTIVKQTRDYMLIKVPLPRADMDFSSPMPRTNGKMTAAEKRGLKRLREAELDIKKGRIISAPSLKEALRKYEKQQWD